MRKGSGAMDDAECSSLNHNSPSIDKVKKPKVGMAFDTLAEGEVFYNNYAKEVGFTVRRHSTLLDKVTKEKYSQAFVCSKEGVSKAKAPLVEGQKQRKRPVIKENCPASIRLLRNCNGKWIVKRFEENHSHACVTPRKRQFLTHKRDVSEAQRSLVGSFREAKMQTSHTISVLEINGGNYNDIGCTERDIWNDLQKERDEKKVYDAQLLLEYFEEEKDIDHSFYYEYKVDDEKRLTHVFWADGLARKAFHHFCDVLVFDTTYSTNQYSMIFAPFTGVNHHRQSVNFGAGFIKDENVDSFIWLFEVWQRAMCSHPPKVIITDQDSAMAAAIRVVFPDVIHRYESREKWIPADDKDIGIFIAGIRTTQRLKSMNVYIDRYVSTRNTLLEFATRFHRAIRRQRQNELAAEHANLYTRPRLLTEFDVEQQMSVIYTRANFNAFQDEFVQSMNYASKATQVNGLNKLYVVKRFGKGKELEASREVMYRGPEESAICSCKKLETDGIPCRHILIVLRNEFVDALPPHYVLRRWITSATNEIVFDQDGIEIGGSYGIEQDLDINQLLNDSHKFLCLAKSSKELYLQGKKLMANALKAMEDAAGPSKCQKKMKSLPSTIEIYPPTISKAKDSGKRIKGGKEKVMEATAKPPRLCRCCKKLVHHDSRNCPLNHSVPSDTLEGSTNESQASINPDV